MTINITIRSNFGSAKAAAKEELKDYIDAIDPADYRPAQQTELANAISAGNTAIDEAADIDAVAPALAGAEAAIDEIKTDAQLTAEEEAAEALADAKADLRDAVAEAKAYYDTIKNDEKYAQIADDLDTAIQQGEAALNSDDIAEVTGMTERVRGVLESAQEQKAVIDAQPDTPDEPGEGCAICGATTHDPNWVGIVHAVLIFVRALLVEALPLIIELAQ